MVRRGVGEDVEPLAVAATGQVTVVALTVELDEHPAGTALDSDSPDGMAMLTVASPAARPLGPALATVELT